MTPTSDHPCRTLRRLLAGLASALVLLVDPHAAASQSRASERASISQTVDGTTITVEYSRPLARGRAQLFGGVVHWGEVWTPGANQATVLDLSDDVTIDGHPVPAGRWSVWMLVAESEPWELVLDPRATLYHTDHPEPTDQQIRFAIAHEQGEEPVDVLTWSFPDVRRDGTTARMDWGTTRVPLEIEVEPTPKSIAVETALPYVGAWELAWEPDSSAQADNDGESPLPPRPFDLRVVADSLLVAHTALPGWSPLDMILMSLADGVFRPGLVMNGEWFEAVGELVLEFEFYDERPVRFAVRDENDEIVARGVRMPGSGATSGGFAVQSGAGTQPSSPAGEASAPAPSPEARATMRAEPDPAWQIAAAVLAAPESLREGAEVRAWAEDGHLRTLREGSNGIICIADRPGDGEFAAACYHDGLEAFMEHGRELTRQGVEGARRNEARWRAIEAGDIPMPVAGMVFNLQFPSEDFDPAATDPATGGRLHAIYMPGATTASTGIPEQPGPDPWLMQAGTPSAHVMIALPARSPE